MSGPEELKLSHHSLLLFFYKPRSVTTPSIDGDHDDHADHHGVVHPARHGLILNIIPNINILPRVVCGLLHASRALRHRVRAHPRQPAHLQDAPRPHQVVLAALMEEETRALVGRRLGGYYQRGFNDDDRAGGPCTVPEPRGRAGRHQSPHTPIPAPPLPLPNPRPLLLDLAHHVQDTPLLPRPPITPLLPHRLPLQHHHHHHRRIIIPPDTAAPDPRAPPITAHLPPPQPERRGDGAPARVLRGVRAHHRALVAAGRWVAGEVLERCEAEAECEFGSGGSYKCFVVYFYCTLARWGAQHVRSLSSSGEFSISKQFAALSASLDGAPPGSGSGSSAATPFGGSSTTTSTFALKVDEVDKRRKSFEFSHEQAYHAQFPPSSSVPSTSASSSYLQVLHSPGGASKQRNRDVSSSSTISSLSLPSSSSSSSSTYTYASPTTGTLTTPTTTTTTPTTLMTLDRLRASPIQEEDEAQLFPLPKRSPSSSPRVSPVPTPNGSSACLLAGGGRRRRQGRIRIRIRKMVWTRMRTTVY
ncbi:hypothetical protein BDZ97DRAFT_728063 [Flammula alnicola]|nr:hypothetical protein BDZ97DRAFT_728063 [Flammula alnicola]